MSLFKNLFKKQETLLFSLLDQADDMYMKSFINKDIRYFQPFASNGLCQKLYDEVLSDEPVLFGTAKTRIRKWLVLKHNDNTYEVQKEVTQKHVQVTKELKLSIGDDVSEVWTLNFDGANVEVLEIAREVI